jgi:hypothetical protein
MSTISTDPTSSVKDEETVLLVTGEGPATSEPADQK